MQITGLRSDLGLASVLCLATSANFEDFERKHVCCKLHDLNKVNAKRRVNLR